MLGKTITFSAFTEYQRPCILSAQLMYLSMLTPSFRQELRSCQDLSHPELPDFVLTRDMNSSPLHGFCTYDSQNREPPGVLLFSTKFSWEEAWEFCYFLYFYLSFKKVSPSEVFYVGLNQNNLQVSELNSPHRSQ